MAEQETVEAAVEILPPPVGSLERAQAREACRIAYCGGMQSLVQLAIKYRIPYDTLAGWSKEERWNEAKAAVVTKSNQAVTNGLVDWIAEQKAAQIKRAVARAGKLQKAADKWLDDEATTLEPSEIQALASAEERADNIVRRNLGMDQQQGSGGSVSINILAGGIQLG